MPMPLERDPKDCPSSQRVLGLQRNVFLLGLTSLFNDFSSEMILSVLPAFFISVLRSGAEALGITEGIAGAAANVIKIYSGRWSDKIQRRKRFATVGYGISVASRPLYLLANTVGAVIGLRLIDRVGKGVREAPRDALISLSASKEEMGRSFGYHRAMDTLGAIAGPLVAFLILKASQKAFSSIFLLSSLIGLAAVACVFLAKDVRRLIESRSEGHDVRGFSLPFKLYVGSVFILASGTLPTAVLLFKTQDLAIAIVSIPLFYMIYSVSYAVCSWPAGRFADVIGTGAVIVVGYVFLILGYVIISVSSSRMILAAGFLVIGIFSALTDGVQRSHLSRLVTVQRRGAGYGYFHAASGFGTLIAGVGGGYLWQHNGDTLALVAAAALIASGLLLFIVAQVVARVVRR